MKRLLYLLVLFSLLVAVSGCAQQPAPTAEAQQPAAANGGGAMGQPAN